MTFLPPRIRKQAKRQSRWRSPAHRSWVRGFACCMCGSTTNVECAHVRMNSGAGIGQKPDDWRTAPLCGGRDGCHTLQHTIGEPEFWKQYQAKHSQSVEQLLEAFADKSPKAFEIRQAKREREGG